MVVKFWMAVKFCPLCGGDDVQQDGTLHFGCVAEYECGDCHGVFVALVVRLAEEDEDE